MAQAESKKNARLPDKVCGKICGAVMTSGRRARSSTWTAAGSRSASDRGLSLFDLRRVLRANQFPPRIKSGAGLAIVR
jgi:hypothetical protein